MNKIRISEIEKKFNNKKFDEVLDKLLPLIKSINNEQIDIPLWNIYYLIGQSYRYKEDFKNASSYLKKSVETLENFSNLKALGIVYQQIGEYNEAVKLLSKSLDLDNSQHMTWNSLGYTQKYMKQYDIAEQSYEKAITAYSRNIVKFFNNNKESVFYPFNELAYKTSLFINYALEAAIYLGVNKGHEAIAIPNGSAAEAIINNKTSRSLFWSEENAKDGKKTMLFMPNFFNTFFHKLTKDNAYYLLVCNKAEVLELQGKEEAKKYWTEAKLFKLLSEKN